MVNFNFSGPVQRVSSGATITGDLTSGMDTVSFTFSVNSGFGLLNPTVGLELSGSRSTLTPVFTTTSGSVISSNTPVSTTASGTLLLTGGQFFSGITLNVAAIQQAQFSVITTGNATIPLAGSTFGGNVTGIKFTVDPGFARTLASIDTNALACFAPGTAIETAGGPMAVEDLTVGTKLRTADGGTTTVKWLGEMPIDTRLVHPARVNPVCITAGALGDGLPARDLRLSPDHAVAIDGYLINAGALVNGVTIYQEPGKMPERFTYYHIETQAHELLLAEGVPAESFVDYAGRDAFDNGDEVRGPIAEMDLPRISAARHVPAHLRERLSPAIAAE